MDQRKTTLEVADLPQLAVVSFKEAKFKERDPKTRASWLPVRSELTACHPLFVLTRKLQLKNKKMKKP
jgi:hypothetical protein